MYCIEFETKRRAGGETWAELANNLRFLTDKAFLELNNNTREHFLMLLDRPELALLVRQRHPRSINEAIAYTLETESHILMMGQSMCYANSIVIVSEDVQLMEPLPTGAAAVEVRQDTMSDLICILTTRLDNLETKVSASITGYSLENCQKNTTMQETPS